ncbi:MAG: hypothetical protein A2008_09815 [Candidatus Wallbacteria bacterium GWC2_49_35]|uniref:cysteine desulfurase n=1 Tax=Candidatus Wallbacteria bacterium GWC2_49_35 TaxID=1817813 RepID=A0A1F7WDR4_9BACT|nr:MAG: hypothetical protein A2008_09815 [Candidatus Wallbacteria bacterium GWC2_49_35]HBC75971.1 hypothetical protein [Candidatus Wallbacteria bacterium]
MKILNFDGCVNLKPEREVIKYYVELLKELHYQNPAAKTRQAEKTAEVIEEARKHFGWLIGADPARIIFTSSGTEANNLAIKGFIAANRAKPNAALSTYYEHSSVIAPLKSAAAAGWSFTQTAVDPGRPEEAANAISRASAKVSLASFILASPETGILYPVEKMANAARAHGITIHSDACAAAGRIRVDVNALKTDMMSVSAHKFGGPAGVGALFVRQGVRIFPLIEGGIEERGLRGGFYNAPAIGAAGLAAKIAMERMDEREIKLRELKKFLFEAINSRIGHARWISGPSSPLSFHASLILENVNAESLISELSEGGVAISPYSWCVSAAKTPDSLIRAGIGADEAAGYIRICLSHENTEKEISRLVNRIAKSAAVKNKFKE